MTKGSNKVLSLFITAVGEKNLTREILNILEENGNDAETVIPKGSSAKNSIFVYQTAMDAKVSDLILNRPVSEKQEIASVLEWLTLKGVNPEDILKNVSQWDCFQADIEKIKEALLFCLDKVSDKEKENAALAMIKKGNTLAMDIIDSGLSKDARIRVFIECAVMTSNFSHEESCSEIAIKTFKDLDWTNRIRRQLSSRPIYYWLIRRIVLGSEREAQQLKRLLFAMKDFGTKKGWEAIEREALKRKEWAEDERLADVIALAQSRILNPSRQDSIPQKRKTRL